MDIEYDEEADAAFIWLTVRPDDQSGLIQNELWPQELQGKVGLLFNAGKRLVGLEVLDASSRLPAELLADLGSRG